MRRPAVRRPICGQETYICAMTTDSDLDRRLAALWAQVDALGEAAFRARHGALIAEQPPGDPVALFERASVEDSTGHADRAVPLYREALAVGLAGPRRRQAVIQLASSLRSLGDAAESARLLVDERDAASDELDPAVGAFLALALVDLGREGGAAALALETLAPLLPRYGRSLAAYARAIGTRAGTRTGTR